MKLRTHWVIPQQADLQIEAQQAAEEGKDLSPFEAEFAALDVPEVDTDPALIARAGELLDAIQRAAPIRADHPYDEPSAIREIQAARPNRPELPTAPTDRKMLREKAYGAWVGRCCGCLLGKPVEGKRRGQMEAYLRSQDRWPLAGYFSNQVTDEIAEKTWRPPTDSPSYEENIVAMPEDDDTNYTATGLALIGRHGRDMTPLDVATFWVGYIPYYHVCTAERIAYRNLVNLLPVPDCEAAVDEEFTAATYRNVYREWIGAQIRGDFFGYCCPAGPQFAAELAWRDACISHVRNGIYGEMWVAAMLAAAYVLDDVEAVIRAGLAEIPANCRLREDIEQVFGWRGEGLDYPAAVDALHGRWDEANCHHWCHTNSNAQIVALALLWGEKDFGRTIARAVMPGFDTDCNGATAGSVLGLMLGRDGIPAAWAGPIRDTLITGVHGYHEVKLAEVADETVDLIQSLRA